VKHVLKFVFVFGHHNDHIGYTPHVGDIVYPLVGFSVSADESGSIHRQHHIQLLTDDIMNQLVIAPLQKAEIDSENRYHPLGSDPCCKGGGMLLGDAHIEASIRESSSKLIHTRSP